jgi:hypothetical protein
MVTCLFTYFIVSIDVREIMGRDESIDPQKSIEVPLAVGGAKRVIEVTVWGKESCPKKNLVDLAGDVSALLGEGSLSAMIVQCKAGKADYFNINAEISQASWPVTIRALPEKLLFICRRLAFAFPKVEFTIDWSVRGKIGGLLKTEKLATYSNYHDYEYFRFLDDEIVRKGKPPTGCKQGIEEKIIKMGTTKTGLQPFSWGLGPHIIICPSKEGSSPFWFLALDIPLEKMPPPFVENKILPNCESLFRELEKETGQAPFFIPIIVRSENMTLGQLNFSQGRVSFNRFFLALRN